MFVPDGFGILTVPFGQVLTLGTAELRQHLFNQILSAQNCIEHISLVIVPSDVHLVLVVLDIDLVEHFLCLATFRHLNGLCLVLRIVFPPSADYPDSVLASGLSLGVTGEYVVLLARRRCNSSQVIHIMLELVV
jgi:hypothetical protein